MKKKESRFSISAGHCVLGSIQVPTPGKKKYIKKCDLQVCTFSWLGGGLSSQTFVRIHNKDNTQSSGAV